MMGNDTIALQLSPGANAKEESAEKRESIKILLTGHTSILALIAFLAFCLKVKYPDDSPYELDYYGTVIMDLVIIDTCYYVVSLVVMAILAARDNTEFDDVMTKISFLFGSLIPVLELLFLIPVFGGILLGFWTCYLILLMIKSYRELQKLVVSTFAFVYHYVKGSNAESEIPKRPPMLDVQNRHNINVATDHQVQDGSQTARLPV